MVEVLSRGEGTASPRNQGQANHRDGRTEFPLASPGGLAEMRWLNHMPPDRTTAEDHYRHFIGQVRERGEVWGLLAGEDWAFCESSEFEDTEVLVFWSDRAYAQRHVQGEWSKHRPTAIPLDEFIDRWLCGMDQDGALVGPNWDAGLDGLEVEPREVADKLTGDDVA